MDEATKKKQTNLVEEIKSADEKEKAEAKEKAKKEIEARYSNLKNEYQRVVAEVGYIERLLKLKDRALAIETEMGNLQASYHELNK